MVASAAELFNDVRPRDRGLTLLIASIVTAAVTLPLLFAAIAADDDEPATGQGLVLRFVDGTVPAEGATMAEGEMVTLAIEDPTVVAAAWALHRLGGEMVAEGVDDTRPILVDHDLGSLRPDQYEIFVTATLREGSQVKRAARFTVTP